MAATPDAYTASTAASRMDSWAPRALCVGKADILACRTLLPGGQRNENPARVMCAACPVRSECLETVLSLPVQADPEDMWIVGGLNHRQRNRERRRRRALAVAAASPSMASAVAEKRCVACEKTLPASRFYRDTHTPTGLSSRCRDCRNSQRRARRRAARAVVIELRPDTRQEVAA